MSAAAAAAAPADAAPKKGKKKLIIILAGVLLLAAVGGGVAVFMMKKKAAEAAAAAEAEESGEGASAKPQAMKPVDPKAVPVYLPLDPFVVNLADREVDRFAQVGITLELEDQKSADQLKLYMPAIRNGILMILAHKTSGELQERAGKERLAREVARAAVLPMGIDVPADDPPAPASAAAKGDNAKKAGKKTEVASPVRSVNFSSFIIQ